MLSLDEIRNGINKWARKNPMIKTVWLFGSYARGEAKPGSDIDLTVDLTDDTPQKLYEIMDNREIWSDEIGSILNFKNIHLGGYDKKELPQEGKFLSGAIILYRKTN
jgi:predicted nucleotidyltransferase